MIDIKDVKVTCFKCKQQMTSSIVSENEIMSYCYPCENDAWQEGADAVNRQWHRSLK